jgi:hypothetical protein
MERYLQFYWDFLKFLIYCAGFVAVMYVLHLAGVV